ncbi:MAG TPA: hypothetical protein VD862_02525 [Candidatus Paceibacterota bacterium]|nr:hypothetical protein [Candidatus Paceibacterota bacterium]
MRLSLIGALFFMGALQAGAQEATPVPADEFTEESRICHVADELHRWLVAAESAIPKDMPQGLPIRVASSQGRLAALCNTQPEAKGFGTGEASAWLKEADAVAVQLNAAVSVALEGPLTAAARRNTGVVALQVTSLQDALNALRADAYDAVTVQIQEKEVPVEKTVTKRDDRDVACRNTVNADIGEAQAFLAAILQENNPLVGLFEEASRGDDSQFGPIMRQTKRAMLRERLEASLESLRGIRNSCSY